MRCEEALKYLSPYLDSELDAKTSFDIARHLESCDSCRERVDAEKRLEAKLVNKLKEPKPGDEAAWSKALRSVPSRRRWWWLALPAAAAALLIFALLPRHDLLEDLRYDYQKLASGRSKLEIDSSNPQEIERFFSENMGLAVKPPTVSDMKLMGARKCTLRGTPTAFMAYRCGDRWISAAIFDGAHIDRFPRDGAALPMECRSEGLSIYVERSGWKVICLVGDASFEELRAVAAGFRP